MESRKSRERNKLPLRGAFFSLAALFLGIASPAYAQETGPETPFAIEGIQLSTNPFTDLIHTSGANYTPEESTQRPTDVRERFQARPSRFDGMGGQEIVDRFLTGEVNRGLGWITEKVMGEPLSLPPTLLGAGFSLTARKALIGGVGAGVAFRF